MLHYPKIPGSKDAPIGRCIAFEKLDGTNLHWEWDRDFGWHAFGTRRDEFNLTPDGVAKFQAAHPRLERAVEVFLSDLAGDLEQVFRENANYRSLSTLSAFTEFVGPNSFAGAHAPGDPMEVVLFDVQASGSGMIDPWQFVADFGRLNTPRVVYEGKLTGAFLEAVREGDYRVTEGVVCKGTTREGDVWMVKTYAYLERLKSSFGEQWQAYWE